MKDLRNAIQELDHEIAKLAKAPLMQKMQHADACLVLQMRINRLMFNYMLTVVSSVEEKLHQVNQALTQQEGGQ